MMNLDYLNLAEQQLLSHVHQALGLMEEKHGRFWQSGLFLKYGKIYESYVELIDSEGEGLEALKRVLFLYWHQMAEPSCFSGLYELPENVSRRAFDSLEKKIESEAIDFELRWMLAYYNMIAEWAFSSYSDLPNLNAFLASADSELWLKVGLKKEDFVNRGQMGNYWRSVIESKAAHSLSGAI